MKKGQYPDPETVETTTTTISTETDSVPPADKPRPPKNSEETAG